MLARRRSAYTGQQKRQAELIEEGMTTARLSEEAQSRLGK